MRQDTGKTRFWATLGMVTLLVIIYPIMVYLRAEESDARLFAGIILGCVVFLLVIIDAVITLVAYLGDMSGG